MNISRASLIALLSLLLSHVALAQNGSATRTSSTYPTPVQGDFVVRDFHFKSGGTLPEFKLPYPHIGTSAGDKNGDARKHVHLMHGTGGRRRDLLHPHHARMDGGPRQLIDTSQ